MTIQKAIERVKKSDGFYHSEENQIIIQALEELEQYRALGTVEELKEAREFKKYFDELYGEGLEVANWHKNGDLEPFDSFYESALEFEVIKEDD